MLLYKMLVKWLTRVQSSGSQFSKKGGGGGEVSLSDRGVHSQSESLRSTKNLLQLLLVVGKGAILLTFVCQIVTKHDLLLQKTSISTEN